MGIFATLAGCAGTTVTIDYADYPENFMIRLEPDQKYVLKNGDITTDFSAMTHAWPKSRQKLTFGTLTRDLSRDVYYRQTEPILIHYNEKDYIWICEEISDNTFVNASFLYQTQYNSLGSDNGSINLVLDSDITDPSDFVMNKYINCFGDAFTSAHYLVNEKGKPEEIPSGDEFYYVDEPYTEEVLQLDEDINTWVFADESATDSTVEVLPAGTTFRRFRVPKNEEYSYVEGIMDDGRIIRVVEEYWFSEPTAYQAMMDKDAKQFSYSSVEN